MTNAESMARKFHEAYERLAPDHGYETRKASAKPWEDVPDNNKSLMIAVCAELFPEDAERAMQLADDSLDDERLVECPDCDGHGCSDCGGLGQLLASELAEYP